MEPIYISLGPNCWGAHHLRKKQLRKVSLPLDWQNTDPKYSLKYVNELINTHFKFYTKNLKYDDNNLVISEYYPYSQFVHYNLIKNKVRGDKEWENKDISLIETLNNRANRFLNIIKNIENNVIFIWKIEKKLFEDVKYTDKYIIPDLKNLFNNSNIICKFTFIIYVSSNNIDYVIDEKFTYKYSTISPNIILKTFYNISNNPKDKGHGKTKYFYI